MKVKSILYHRYYRLIISFNQFKSSIYDCTIGSYDQNKMIFMRETKRLQSINLMGTVCKQGP